MDFETTYFIGDVHGCNGLLRGMLDFIKDEDWRASARSRLVFLGDIVDRGFESSDALETVSLALARWRGSKVILGNHDDMFLAAFDGAMSEAKTAFWMDQCGGWQTCASYDPSGELDAARDVILRQFPHHIDMLGNADVMLDCGEFVACHAGINAWLPRSGQSRHDLMWITDGFLDRVDPSMPIVIHGHSIMDELPVVTENRISLDTGAHDTGRLTALRLDGSTGACDFYQTAFDGGVKAVAPVLHDRGQGSALDRLRAFARSRRVA